MTNNLKELREHSQYSIADIASKLGVTTQTIYNWEKSEPVPNKATLFLLADIFKVKPEDIIAK